MGTSLNGLNPASTYQALIKVGNNTNLNTTLKTLSDGAGNDLPMQASTTAINFTGTVSGVASGVSGAIQFSNGSAFASDANNLFWDDANNRLGVGTNTPTTNLTIYGGSDTLGITGAVNQAKSIQIARYNSSDPLCHYIGDDGDNFFGSGLTISASGSNSQLYLQVASSGRNVNIGTAGQTLLSKDMGARLGVRGSGTTSATTSLLVQNSGGTSALTVKDDLNTIFGGKITLIGAGTIINSFGGFEVSVEGGVNTIDFFNGAFLSTAGQKFLSRPYNSNTRLLTSVLIGADTTQNASAQLQMDTTTQGFLPPRMTTTQKNAIASPAEGLQMYDSTAKSPAYYDGTNWGYTGGALQNAAGNSGTLNISFAAGNIVNLTLNANTTLAFSNAVIGTYIIQVTQGATGANVLTYPASVKWAGGTAPTLTTTVGKTDILTFYYDGTNYYGNYSLDY